MTLFNWLLALKRSWPSWKKESNDTPCKASKKSSTTENFRLSTHHEDEDDSYLTIEKAKKVLALTESPVKKQKKVSVTPEKLTGMVIH